MNFYPSLEDAQKGGLSERIDVLMEGAERFKSVVLDEAKKAASDTSKPVTPKEQPFAYNWEEIASVLSSIRNMPEGSKIEKMQKANLLTKLAEVYEVLRAAKMSKLEAVRLALISEANQLLSGAGQGV